MNRCACLSACLLLALLSVLGCGQKPPPTTETPSTPGAKTALTGVALGEQIFKTGVGASGQHIPFTKGSPMFASKPKGCAGCHGDEGLGKKLGKITCPCIRYSALCMPLNGRPAMYSDKTVRKAVITGVNEDGNPLDPTMPRWKMTDGELTALLAYLKTLDSLPGTPEQSMSAPAKPAPKTK
jgi:mono/diheme cytochrome c family protein